MMLLIFLAVAFLDLPNARQFRLRGLRGLVQPAPEDVA
jgi:hypothetical protein